MSEKGSDMIHQRFHEIYIEAQTLQDRVPTHLECVNLTDDCDSTKPVHWMACDWAFFSMENRDKAMHGSIAPVAKPSKLN